MGEIVYPNTFTNDSVANADEVNANFDAIKLQVNGNIDADNLANGAVTNAKLAGSISPFKLDAGDGFRATMSADQTIAAASTDTTVEFDTEDHDLNSNYNNATYKYVTPTAGLYLVGARVNWNHDTATSDNRDSIIKLKIDGSDVYAGDRIEVGDANKPTSNQITTLLNLSAGSSIEVTAYTTDAGNYIENSLKGSEFWAMPVGSTS